MLDKEEVPPRLQYPLHLCKRFRGIRDGTQSPRHHDGVDALIGKRQRLFGGL
jgi:hypothetical protein